MKMAHAPCSHVGGWQERQACQELMLLQYSVRIALLRQVRTFVGVFSSLGPRLCCSPRNSPTRRRQQQNLSQNLPVSRKTYLDPPSLNNCCLKHKKGLPEAAKRAQLALLMKNNSCCSKLLLETALLAHLTTGVVATGLDGALQIYILCTSLLTYYIVSKRAYLHIYIFINSKMKLGPNMHSFRCRYIR